jgi:hypothetical protein
VYKGGITVTDNAIVNLAPGVYIVDGGGLVVSLNGSIRGTGVLVYNTAGGTSLLGVILNALTQAGGVINISGNGAINLTPPTDGTYQGINFFQDRQNLQPITITGNGSIRITGTGYAPAATVTLTGSSTTTGDVLGGFIANGVVVTGNSSFAIVQGAVRARVPEIGLVE